MIVAVLLLLAGGVGIFALTRGGDDSAKDPVSQPVFTPSTAGDPSASGLQTPEPTPTEVTGSTVLGTPGTAITSPPTFSGETPTQQEYVSVATSFISLSMAGDCKGAKALLQKQYERSVSEDYYCTGDAKQRLRSLQLNDPSFTDFRTAGASVEFRGGGGVATVFMSFTTDQVILIDAVYI